ncbi:hypothetical protein [Mycobacteroides abscessus]|uniref:hypothetical protein n=1 Tax=Mycobacteroides abscessus TaxID=36809 RepID=UPI00092C52EE|nr:hypothetical protein [Mycobacteroides abscessus]SHP22710.1 Uncharacterised protein [Mycobacteroides abscessus subsp. abscessus]
MDELISRIGRVLDEEEEVDDIPWSDSWRWAPPGVELPQGVWEESDDSEADSGWDYHPDTQIHAIPSVQVAEWRACLETLPTVERGDIAWYVVCFACGAAGERSVDCGCG